MRVFFEVYYKIFSFSQQKEKQEVYQSMLEYPIYKLLAQFSYLVDDKGVLLPEYA